MMPSPSGCSFDARLWAWTPTFSQLEKRPFVISQPARCVTSSVNRGLELRSLDAIHLASARTLGRKLEAVVTYDQRLASAAAWYGMPVVSPS